MQEQINFSQYFDNWLYSDTGYYSNYKTIGKEGDFFTAVSTSSFFGGSIGKKIVTLIEEGHLANDTTIVEIGAHHGYLLADIIQFIYTLKPKLLDTLNFAIVERYDYLQKQQKQYFENSFGEAIKLKHYDDISQFKAKNAMIIANEIFDAFSCELVYTTKDDILQKAVVQNHNIEFINLDTNNTNDKKLIDICTKYKITKGEVSQGFEEFANTLNQNIEQFDFITFDYGDFYPRNDFSTRIYHKHNVYPIFQDDIKLDELYQKSDITCDVHFNYLIDCFSKAGIKNVQSTTQLKALVEFGIIQLLEILHNNANEETYLTEANKVKTLLTPTGMGDRFKMVHFRKNKDIKK
jgi:SAM-dependent MidA family methyltransferase